MSTPKKVEDHKSRREAIRTAGSSMDLDMLQKLREEVGRLEADADGMGAAKILLDHFKNYGKSAGQILNLFTLVATGYGKDKDLLIRDYFAELDKGIKGNGKAVKELASYLKEEVAERRADIDRVYGLLDGFAKNLELTAKLWDSEELPKGWVGYESRRKTKL